MVTPTERNILKEKMEINTDIEAICPPNCNVAEYYRKQGYQLAQKEERKRVCEIIEEMFEENKRIMKDRILPKGLRIPFINGEEFLAKINEEKSIHEQVYGKGGTCGTLKVIK
jgi:hypothetical protein